MFGVLLDRLFGQCRSCPSLVAERDPHPLCYTHRECSRNHPCLSYCIGLSEVHFDDLENTARLGLRHRHKSSKGDTVDTAVAAPMGHGTSTMGAPALDKQAVPSRTASESKGSAARSQPDSMSDRVAGSRAATTSENPSGLVAGGCQSTSENPSGLFAGGHPSVAGEATGLVPEAVASDGQHDTGTPGLPGSNPIMQHAYRRSQHIVAYGDFGQFYEIWPNGFIYQVLQIHQVRKLNYT